MKYSTGKLIRWFNHKGYGFIKPETGEDIFIHISALKSGSGKPRIGDIIRFEISIDDNGKRRAINVKIEGSENNLKVTPFNKGRKTTDTSHNKKRLNRYSAKAKKPSKILKSALVFIIAILGFSLNSFQQSDVDFIHPTEKLELKAGDTLYRAYKNKQSDVQVAGTGIVSRTLADDTTGSQHQRFILKLASGQTLLVAHNIDLAPRINALRAGDKVDFYGEYEWNANGGVLHWTHKDPRAKHKSGWLRHKGVTYQ